MDRFDLSAPQKTWEEPKLIAICGVKNSGKTTLIEKLLPVLTRQGLLVAVIKHDGHEFDADVPGTDSYRHFHAGAYGTAVYSASKMCIVKKENFLTPEKISAFFPEADLILLEGGKSLSLPKICLVGRRNKIGSEGKNSLEVPAGLCLPSSGVSQDPEIFVYCGPEVLAYVADRNMEKNVRESILKENFDGEQIPIFGFDEPEMIARRIVEYCQTGI